MGLAANVGVDSAFAIDKKSLPRARTEIVMSDLPENIILRNGRF
jgi:hypothetical protein